MLTLDGCCLDTDDADRLVAALEADGSYASLEAAAAIRWAGESSFTVDLEPDLRDTILHALDDSSPGLVELRRAITLADRAHRRPGLVYASALVKRLHNPQAHHCGCLSDCWCRRTAWGRVVRWYVPQRYHTSVSPCWEFRRS